MKNNLSDKEKENLVKELCQTISKLKEAGIIRDNRSIIGNLGEYQCAKHCNLKLEKRTNEYYFDAKTRNGKKVQIKTSTIKLFCDIKDGYDWLYLVTMNGKDLKVKEIYAVAANDVKQLLNKKAYKGVRWDLTLSQKKIRSGLLKLIFPKQ